MSEPENPLLRWSRLKQAAKAVDAASVGSEPVAGPEPPFDPASLPSIESIAADTDIIAFLRAGVPAELTRAALRRAWTSDPAVRDFIGIAENQWDFNDPNAIAGFGPLASTESTVDILAQISSGLARQPHALPELTATEPAATNADADEPGQQLATSDLLLPSPGAAPDDMRAIAETENWPAVGGARKSRRHGSALPR